MTDKHRYRDLNNALKSSRREYFNIRIKGAFELSRIRDSVIIEALKTGF
jgi:hypothetical protein